MLVSSTVYAVSQCSRRWDVGDELECKMPYDLKAGLI